MEVTQEDADGKFTVKTSNSFRDAEKKENINGYPSPEGDTDDYSKDDWNFYFLQARKFLVSFTKEKMQAAVAQAVIVRGTAVPRSAEQEERLRNSGRRASRRRWNARTRCPRRSLPAACAPTGSEAGRSTTVRASACSVRSCAASTATKGKPVLERLVELTGDRGTQKAASHGRLFRYAQLSV